MNVSLQKRQKGISSGAHDPAQNDVRNFFGGGVIDSKQETLEEGESNALDEATVPRV